ncbi:MAG TPA: hypothetical protein VG603_07765 [Chitinophagales bacterium]|nr:hypothetical protein [Chitinophagales bacterium]
MRIKSILSFAVMAGFLFFTHPAMAQTQPEGDGLSTYIGKAGESEDLKSLEENYKLSMATNGHYLSDQGIELVLKNGILDQINLYSKSTVYGNFSGRLPRNLKFGMTSADVKAHLGKPLVAYSSGYAEFALADCVISCWFDHDRLMQVGINSKNAQ